MRRRSVIGLALIVFAAELASAPAAQATDQISSQTTPPVTLTVRFAGGRTQFRPGETLSIELEFDSRVPKRFVVDGATYDRTGRLTIDDFMIEPDAGVSDPLLDYFAASGGSIGGGIRAMGVLGAKPFVITLDLNERFRFEKPGTYTLSVRSRRVSDDLKTDPPMPSVPAVESQTVSFEILPRDPVWEEAELGAALQMLNAKGPDTDRRKGCRMLRFLGTDAAVDEMIKRYGESQWECAFEFTAGLFGAWDRERAIRLLEAGLRAADQPVSEAYLRTLALLTVYTRHPELRSAQTRETKGKVVPSGDLSRLQDLVNAAQAAYTEILDAALPEKSARARAIILSWRVESGRHGDPASPASSTASRNRLREMLAATFLALSNERQATLLEYQWPTLAGPAMVPVLRELIDRTALSPTPLRDLALRRLYELAPEEGRTRILRAITNPSPGASLRTLGLLPDRELPELDDVLAANVEASRDVDALSIRAELLHRYASPAISARVLSRVDDGLMGMACRPQAALLAYFVRADADLGRTLLDRALASRADTGCYTVALREVAKLRMTPVVEASAVAHLEDPNPQVVINAAETLGRYGSPASAQALRARFEGWHRAWKGREEELRYSHAADRPHAMQGMVELALLQALGRGQGWLTDDAGLRELRTLCVTDNCRTHADQLIDSAGDTRITILRVDDPDNSLGTLAQYHLVSISAFRQKLAQYPKGSSFTLDVTALEPQIAPVVVSDLMELAAARGLTVRR
jgi:hypothetical protein